MKLQNEKMANKKIFRKILFFTFILLNLVSFHSCNFRVGFFSANIEGEKYNHDQVLEILKAFTFTANNNFAYHRIINFDDLSGQYPDVMINKFDVLLISFQEVDTNVSMTNFESILNEIAGQQQSWRCSDDLVQTGRTKLTAKATFAKVCYKKEMFQETAKKQGSRGNFINNISGDLKTSLGICLKLENSNSNDPQYCFFGLHFDCFLNKGFKTTENMIGFVDSVVGVTRDVYMYTVGDYNIRSWYPKSVVDKDIKDLVISNLNGSPNYLSTVMVESDQKVVDIYEENVNTNESRSIFKFCGNENLRRLPYTHSLRYPKTKKDTLTFEDYNFDDFMSHDAIFNKKKVMVRENKSNGNKKEEKIKAYNLGWLDRMACVHIKGENPEEENNCRLSSGDIENGVFYSALPSLRLADHLPMLGYFEVRATTSKRKMK